MKESHEENDSLRVNRIHDATQVARAVADVSLKVRPAIQLLFLALGCEMTACRSTCSLEDDADSDGYYRENAYCKRPADALGSEADYADDDATVYPGADEVCDEQDNNLDGLIPHDEIDKDNDAWMTCEGDCNDQDATVNPGIYDSGETGGGM